MAWVFSKRCKESLKKKKIKVSIPRPVRQRVWLAMEYFSDDFGENFVVLSRKIKSEHGIELMAFPDDDAKNAKPSDLEGFILRGNYPPYFLDALELFYEEIYGDAKVDFQRAINEIMEEGNLPWRMSEGKIFPVDSHYIEEVVLRKSHELMKEAKFEGALHEFEKARTDLVCGDCHGAIQNANLAVESVIKGILDIKKAKPGELFRRLIDSQIVPEYYAGFLKAFEENILRCANIMRNEELGAGHGQGRQINEIPEELAELGVHLSGVLIHYLIKRHIANTPVKKEEQYEISDDDLPF